MSGHDDTLDEVDRAIFVWAQRLFLGVGVRDRVGYRTAYVFKIYLSEFRRSCNKFKTTSRLFEIIYVCIHVLF